MASTTWHIQGIDTDGRDLVLSQIQPWSASGEEIPLSITSTFPPTSGALDDLLIADSTECVFAAADVQKPGFAIVFTFNTAVDLWGFRFAGPSPDTWLLRHIVVAGGQAAALTRVPWVAGVLSPEPTTVLEPGVLKDEWVAQPGVGSRNWYGCATSNDGQVLLGAPSGGPLTLSKDGGATWNTVNTGVTSWQGCAVSADGQTMLAAPNTTTLRLSKDGGDTWVAQAAAGSRPWTCCAMSPDGQTLLAANSSTPPWLSKNGGATWEQLAAFGSRQWLGCAVSADGQTLLLSENGGSLWLSKDGGDTATAQSTTGAGPWRGCAVSTDGQVLLATAYTATAWLSKDGGNTWFSTPASVVGGYGCAMSANGQVMLVGTENGYLWLSRDGGTTWVAQVEVGPRLWYGCAMSGDGKVGLSGTYAGGGSLWLNKFGDPIYLPNTPRTYTPRVAVAVQGLPPDAQGTLNTYAAEAVQFNDFEFSGNGRVYGTVERKNTPDNVPLRRRVRLHRSRDGMLVRETWSKPDGSYEFKHVSMHYEYDAIAWDHEMSYRSVIANNLKPEAM